MGARVWLVESLAEMLRWKLGCKTFMKIYSCERKEETFRRTCHRPHLSSGELQGKCGLLEIMGQMLPWYWSKCGLLEVMDHTLPWYLNSLRCGTCSSPQVE